MNIQLHTQPAADLASPLLIVFAIDTSTSTSTDKTATPTPFHWLKPSHSRPPSAQPYTTPQIP
ncbi:MAG: hypothetical protein HIU91_16370, partial [Acidobacteria bacterium]|nr:hypothetical protein [Acidobacteriota bacterium]